MATKKISLKKILLALFAVVCVLLLVLCLVIWRSMSYSITAAPVDQEYSFAWYFDDFAIDIPVKSDVDFKILAYALNWPEGRILLHEHYASTPGGAREALEESQKELAAKFGEVRDISEEMGRPAILVPRLPESGLADKPTIALNTVAGHVRLGFILMLPDPPADIAPLETEMKKKVRDFLRYYRPIQAPEAPPPMHPWTEYGWVAPGAREGYAFTLGFAQVTRGTENFMIQTITDGERLAARDGFGNMFSRFFKNLAATGVISGIGINEMELDGKPGHEIVRKHPYFSDEPVALEFDWQEAGGGKYARSFTYTCMGESAQNPAACYGRWKQILQSIRFTK